MVNDEASSKSQTNDELSTDGQISLATVTSKESLLDVTQHDSCSQIVNLSNTNAEQSLFSQNQNLIQEIEEEVRNTQPLVSDKQDIIQLVLSYDEASSPAFFAKALELAGKYTHIRRIRGDGNCFYRAMLTAVLEKCVGSKDELSRCIALCNEWKQKFIGLGSSEFIVDDYCGSISSVLESVKNGSRNLAKLISDLNADEIANYCVAFMRTICAGYMRANPDEFSGFIEGDRTLDQFCKEEIEPFWKDCDHMAVMALVKALGVPIRIEYMDQSFAPNGGWHHDFLTSEKDGQKLFFLYRPGHYDILYPAII